MQANGRLAGAPAASVVIRGGDFLAMGTEHASALPSTYDLVISNPPYVRTQVLGAARAQALGRQFGLTGRVDLYHAFVAAMTAKLADGGVLGLLCSNRFLTTKGGHSLRSVLLRHYEVAELWDLGDTKLFGAAVLPAVVVARRVAVPSPAAGSFVRIYEDHGTSSEAVHKEGSLLEALERDVDGTVEVKKALGAVKHSIICAAWHMLSTGELYADLGGDYYQRRDPNKTTKRLVAQLERLGHTVTLQEGAVAA